MAVSKNSFLVVVITAQGPTFHAIIQPMPDFLEAVNRLVHDHMTERDQEKVLEYRVISLADMPEVTPEQLEAYREEARHENL